MKKQLNGDLSLEKINAQRITHLEGEIGELRTDVKAIGENVAMMAGHFKTEKNFGAKNGNGSGMIIALFISITLGVGGMLQQQINFSREFDKVTNEATLAEILRIRGWKDEVETTLPAHISASEVQSAMLIKTMDTLEERMTYLTKKFFEFQTCYGIQTDKKGVTE